MASEKNGSAAMQEIHPASLSHLATRISYLKSFQDFTEEDGALIASTAPLVGPLVPTILDAVYTKLLSYDITAKAFVPRQPGHTGTVPTKPQELDLQHPQILHRKDFLKHYLVKLVSNRDWSDESRFWEYLDKVGVMHTGQPGFDRRKGRPELRVEYVHVGMLLGFVEDKVAAALLAVEGIDLEQKIKIVRAFNKLLWIQNDLFSRHYAVDRDTQYAPAAAITATTPGIYLKSLTMGLLGTMFVLSAAKTLGLS
ncbi:MAG: hypothetical protein M1833_000595 [Piccolia ochrophora]|nr:MAG: hypothetical protein M1833_000595 [Piccolia ochrophora]